MKIDRQAMMAKKQCARIIAFWNARGYAVKATVAEDSDDFSNALYPITSDMVNGWPRNKWAEQRAKVKARLRSGS